MRNERTEHALLLGIAFATITARVGSAQSLVSSKISRELWPEGMSAFDARLLVVDDQDSDGIGEILVGDWNFRYPDMVLPWGRVSLLDGASGEERWGVLGEVGPFQTTDNLGFSVTEIGDRDGDGVADILAGCLLGPARIFSGADGTEIHRSPGAVEEVACLGDVDRDGHLDLALRRTVAPWGAIDVHSGRTLGLLYTVQPPFLSYLFGSAIVSLGDVDDDHVPDFAVSAPDNVWDPIRDDCFETFVFVYSGIDGRLLYHLARPGLDECESFGYSLVAAGDLNGDGRGDLVVGLPNVGGVSTSRPRLYFHDGKSGERLAEIEPPADSRFQFGRVLAPVGDCNGNGYPDFLVFHGVWEGLGVNPRGEVLLLDGGTREFLYRIRGDPAIGPSHPVQFGLAMAGNGDQDGDDFPDFLIGTLGLSRFHGRLDWFSGAPQGVRALGKPCSRGGVAPRIGASGVPRIGSDYALHLSRVEPGQKAFLVVGLPVAGPAGRGGRFSPSSPLLCNGGTFVPSKLYLAAAEATVQGDAAATVHIPLANDLALVGQVLLAQWFLVGGPGSAATRVLEITIQDAERTRDG